MNQPKEKVSRKDALADYVTVAERIEKFYERYPEGRILTHVIEHDMERGFVLIRTEVYRQADDAQPAATGHAFEIKSEGYVQRTSYVEVCETSSVGRALALCGFEVKRGIASREEIQGVGAKPADGLANDLQRKKFASLVNRLGFSNKEVSKALQARGVGLFEELTSEKAEELLNSLLSKLKDKSKNAEKEHPKEIAGSGETSS